MRQMCALQMLALVPMWTGWRVKPRQESQSEAVTRNQVRKLRFERAEGGWYDRQDLGKVTSRRLQLA